MEKGILWYFVVPTQLQECAILTKNGIRDACNTADIIDCHILPQTASDWLEWLGLITSVYTGINPQKLLLDWVGIGWMDLYFWDWMDGALFCNDSIRKPGCDCKIFI